MPTATTQRLLDIHINGLQTQMLLTHVDGTMNLGQPFQFLLTLAAANTQLSAQDLLGKSVTITLNNGSNNSTTFNGLVDQFSPGPSDYDGWRNYQLVIKPWLSFLNYSQDCRIFQQQTVPQILTSVFKAHQFADYDLSALQADYQPRSYCVQYNETAFDFVQRLMQEAGIYYTFKHSANKHVLTLADLGFAAANHPQTVVASDDTQSGCRVHHWHEQCQLRQVKTTRREYQFQNPQAIISQSGQNANAAVPGTEHFEDYRYPSEIANNNDTSLQQHVNRQVGAGSFKTIHASSNIVGFQPGLGFSVASSGQANGRFMLTQVKISAHDDSHRGHQVAESADAQHFSNDFSAIPADVRFVPKQIIAKPKINNVQTAVVVGPKNKEIYTDRYGRVKVQFHWDHAGTLDENSSCWIRSEQPWAGDGWGGVFIPRVGQEALVEFEDGNPDRPWVIGTVPNADNLPPFTPAKTPTRSGFQTQTLGATTTAGNTLRFDDDPDNPEVFFNAQKDYALSAEGNSQYNIGGNYTETVASGNYQHDCDGNLMVQAAKEIRLTCGGSEILINQGGISVQGDQVAINPFGGSAPIPTSSTDSTELLHQVIGKLSPTTPIKNNTTQQKNIIPLEELIYVTGAKTLYALTEDELTALKRATLPLETAIQNVKDANAETGTARTDKIKSAKAALNKTLKPLVHSPSSNDLTEIVRFNGHKWSYVPKDKLQQQKSSWRKYDLDSEDKAKSIMTNGKLDLKKLKSKLSNNAKVDFATDVTGSVGSWANTINQKANLSEAIFGAAGMPKLDVSANAQLLRYTAGLGASGDFDPGAGKVSFSADGHAELAIAEAKVSTKCSIPSEEGWQLNFTCKGLNGKENTCNFGAIRLDADLGLFGFVGASVLGSVDVACSVVSEKNTAQLKLKGTNQEGKTETATSGEDAKASTKSTSESADNSEKDKTNNGATVGVNAFAGAKAGCDAGCGILWQNPEPPESDGESSTASSSGSGAENGLRWSELASLAAEGDAAAGIGGKAEFSVNYDRLSEKFVVEAKAGIICGLGLSGQICTVVYAKNIVSFVQFIYHKIMSRNFPFIGFIEGQAFKALRNLLFKYIIDIEKDLEDIFQEGLQYVTGLVDKYLSDFSVPDKRLAQTGKLVDGINHKPYRLSYTPPEVKGRILCLLTNLSLLNEIKHYATSQAQRRAKLKGTPFVQSELEQAILQTEYEQIHKVEQAILTVLSYIQSKADYINVMQHMTLNMTKISATQGEQQLFDAEGIYRRSQLQLLKKFKDELGSLEQLFLYPESIEDKINKPVSQSSNILAIGGYAA